MKRFDTSFLPYIGITDFMNRSQTIEMLHCFNAASRLNNSHKLMVGVMMSYKTLNGLDTKWTKAFPTNEQVSDIFVQNSLAFNTLHYADYTNTDVCKSLVRAISCGGVNIDALQLDMVWPEPSDVFMAVHGSRKCISVILQIGTNAMAEVNDSPQEVIKRLEDYVDVVDGVLFDKSLGQGKPMDAEVLLPYVEAVYEHLPKMRVAVAGGLGAFTMNVAGPLISRFPDISIDAQGRLRPSGNALDPIDWGLAKKYLQEAKKLFIKNKPS